MSIGAPVAADCPSLFDVIINGQGYILYRAIETSLPFRTQRAKYSRSPTFLERQNVTGDYGDNQQDFWQTASMRDWSLGEDQKFFRGNDPEGKRQFFLGSNINVTIPGQVTLERAATALTFAAACSGAGSYPAGSQTFTSSSTNLYEVSSTGTITDRGAHGCGGLITAYATDGTYLYVSGAACTKTRRYDLSAHTFADFSAQATDSLTFLNNTVYGTSGGTLYNFDTGGVKGDLFDQKTGTGTVLSGAQAKLEAFGGKVLILRYSQTPRGPELWQYDGTGESKLAEYPPNFRADDFCVSSGIVFIIGVEGKVGDGFRTAIYYYANGNSGRAWANNTFTNGTIGSADIAPFGDGVIFTDVVNGRVRFYDLAVGGVSSVASYTPTSGAAQLAVANQYVLLTQASTAGTFLFASTKASSGNFQTSIVDFDSSLTKLFRGVIVDWVAASDGNGGTVDIAYQVDDVASAGYTNLQTSAASGTEYNFSGNPTGRGVSLKITINMGTSTLGPTVKRVYLRASPVLQSYRQCEYILDCSGRKGLTPLILNDNETPHPVTGVSQALNLNTAITSTVPISISDRFGTYTAIIEPNQSELIEISPEEYIARIFTRQV